PSADTDLATSAGRGCRVDASKITAGEMARGTPRWIDAGADVGDVLREMQDHQIRRLPVIENKRLVGMISEADLAQHLNEGQIASWAESVYARSGPAHH
ncbi:CBS domain-containing protein, partial [Streptomyces sp. NPDC002920]